MNAEYVAYQGEGDQPIKLEGADGVYPFTIQHRRYKIWVACTSSGGSPSLRVLVLAAEDTQRPVARCFVNAESAGLTKTDVTISQTPMGTLAGFAVGDIQSNDYEVTGSSVNQSVYHASSEPFDLVTTLKPFDGGPRSIRLHRGLQVEADRQIGFDFSEHQPVQLAPLPAPLDRALVQTRLRTQNHTWALLHEESASSVALLPAQMIRSGDVYQVTVSRGSGSQESYRWSYRTDPTTATTSTPEFIDFYKVSLDPDGQGSLLFPEELRAQVISAIVLTDEAYIEVLASAAGLGAQSSVALRPPAQLAPGWRLGAPGGLVAGGLGAYQSNRSVTELLEKELFSPYEGLPIERDGWDVEVSFHAEVQGTLD